MKAHRQPGLLVLSGADDSGRSYVWNHDLFKIRPRDLAVFERHHAERLTKVLEELPLPEYGKRKAVA